MAESIPSSLPSTVARSLWSGVAFCAVHSWKWPVLSVAALFVIAFGVSAMYGDQYIVAASAYFLGITLLTARTLGEARQRKDKAGVAIVNSHCAPETDKLQVFERKLQPGI